MNSASITHRIESRNALYARTLEHYLRSQIVDGYDERAREQWHRDYACVEAYEKSVEPMRQRWRATLSPPVLRATGELKYAPALLHEAERTQWVELPLGSLCTEGLLSLPESANRPAPLVIVQHGISSSPERAFGHGDVEGIYHGYADALVREGFAVLAPMNLAGVEHRNRLQKLAGLAGLTLPGIEFARLQHLLDAVLELPEIDQERVGMWGISLGGMATQFFTPLEPRIGAAVSSAWFNHRPHKMAVPDPRYSCFIDSAESHAFLPGWLTAFADHDLLSLICPRPILIQCGKSDGIAWWPQVLETFERLRDHYHRLHLDDRVAIDLHGGVHEVRLESGLAWMRRFVAQPSHDPVPAHGS